MNENSNIPADDPDMDINDIAGGFTYSNINLEDVEDTPELTLIQLLLDTTGSMANVLDKLRDTVVAIINDCKKHNRSENLLIRVVTFDDRGSGDMVRQIHGFKLPSTIDTNDYQFKSGGSTPSSTAAMEVLMTLVDFAEKMKKDDHLCNSVIYMLTDGEESPKSWLRQKYNVADVKKKIEEITKSEKLLSNQFFLIGLRDQECQQVLDQWCKDAGLDGYESAEKIVSGGLGAETGGWISQHISSTSALLAKGGQGALPSLT